MSTKTKRIVRVIIEAEVDIALLASSPESAEDLATRDAMELWKNPEFRKGVRLRNVISATYAGELDGTQ